MSYTPSSHANGLAPVPVFQVGQTTQGLSSTIRQTVHILGDNQVHGSSYLFNLIDSSLIHI